MKAKVERLFFETTCHISEVYALANSETSDMQLKRVHLEDFFDWVDTYPYHEAEKSQQECANGATEASNHPEQIPDRFHT